ncbi:MAG: HU family DNA-binding protein [Candidatus Alectryocaccobium sp.]|nr:HU family DNA-binding protein [Lachnospiraceae bacterium]MDY6221340.1 HU family DNA-binding protein [Candidatus Alectryocaccobium sp.]
MRKKELAEAIAKKTGLTKANSELAVQAFIDVIGEELKNGESVQLIGFGTFDVLDRPARMGRNPLTGKDIEIKASKSPRFKAGKALKDKVNG